MVDLNHAMNKLGITKSQASALDKLDGKQDGIIADNIWEQAVSIYEAGGNNQETLRKMSKEANTPLFHQIVTIFRNSGANTVNKPSVKNTEPTEVKKMKEMADSAIKYYAENQSMNGFSFVGFPRGITNLDITTQIGYDDSSNDVFTYGDEGQKVTRNPDAFTLTIKFKLNDKEYSVSAESKDFTKFKDKPTQEEFIRNLTEYMNNAPDIK